MGPQLSLSSCSAVFVRVLIRMFLVICISIQLNIIFQDKHSQLIFKKHWHFQWFTQNIIMLLHITSEVVQKDVTAPLSPLLTQIMMLVCM